jgi:hypothetical protein
MTDIEDLERRFDLIVSAVASLDEAVRTLMGAVKAIGAAQVHESRRPVTLTYASLETDVCYCMAEADPVCPVHPE